MVSIADYTVSVQTPRTVPPASQALPTASTVANVWI